MCLMLVYYILKLNFILINFGSIIHSLPISSCCIAASWQCYLYLLQQIYTLI